MTKTHPPYIRSQVDWTNNYYGQLVGMKVVAVESSVDCDGVWPVLICQGLDKSGQAVQYALEVSRDPEGNGPGFISGLPSVNRKVK